MSTKNQREQLMHSATGQVAIIVLVLVLSWIYTIPLHSKLSATIDATNTNILAYKATAKDGIAYSAIDGLFKKSGGKEEILGIIQSAPVETQNAIKKVGGEPYLTWIIGEIGKSQEDKEKLSIKKARLNSILPTLNPVSNNISEDTVSMKKYISYIEENIIKKFGIDSSTTLSLQSIKYGGKGSSMPESVGSFDNDISFKSTNANIAKMIEYINDLGKPDVLLNTGSVIAGGEPAIMSNPLAMIDSLALEQALDLSKPNEPNSGRMTIRFYVRGSSASDITFLSSTISLRKTTLGKKIEAAVKKCEGEDTCPRKKEYQSLSRKFTEFTRSNPATTANKQQGTAQMYALSAELNSIVSLEEELKKLTGIK
ncbi:hypothetical protein K2X92_03135 [Candidatus Gracilibacteria bacterium]|nr:hypothetical protein [Candidatus Gracilibacteria bacterium]